MLSCISSVLVLGFIPDAVADVAAGAFTESTLSNIFLTGTLARDATGAAGSLLGIFFALSAVAAVSVGAAAAVVVVVVVVADEVLSDPAETLFRNSVAFLSSKLEINLSMVATVAEEYGITGEVESTVFFSCPVVAATLSPAGGAATFNAACPDN